MKPGFKIFNLLILTGLVLVACGTAVPDNMPMGEWTGAVDIGNGASLPIEITFLSCAKGETCANVNYPSMDCTSTFTLLRVKDGLPEFEETLTYGNYCKSGRTVQMTHVDANTPMMLQWFEKDGDPGPTASLNSGRAVFPTQEPISIPGFGREVFAIQNLGLWVNWRAVLADGSLWVPDSANGNLLRIDTATNEVVATIQVGDPSSPSTDGYDPNSVAAQGDQIWVTQRAQSAVGRIDPSTNTLVETVQVRDEPYELILDGNYLWIGSFDGDTLTRMDLKTREMKSVYVNKPIGVAVGGGFVWAVEHRNGNLVKIDPVTVDFISRIDLSLPPPNPGAQPEEVIYAEGSVWVANNGGRTISRVDPNTDEIIATITVEGRRRPVHFTVGGGYIWVACVEEIGSEAGSAIVQIDPATNEIVRTTPFPLAFWLAYDNGTLWVGDGYYDKNKQAGDRILRIELEP